MKNNRFQRGSALYTCRSCGKRTRETGSSESNNLLCAKCYEEGGLENEHEDGHHRETPADGCLLCTTAKVMLKITSEERGEELRSLDDMRAELAEFPEDLKALEHAVSLKLPIEMWLLDGSLEYRAVVRVQKEEKQ